MRESWLQQQSPLSICPHLKLPIWRKSLKPLFAPICIVKSARKSPAANPLLAAATKSTKAVVGSPQRCCRAAAPLFPFLHLWLPPMVSMRFSSLVHDAPPLLLPSSMCRRPISSGRPLPPQFSRAFAHSVPGLFHRLKRVVRQNSINNSVHLPRSVPSSSRNFLAQ